MSSAYAFTYMFNFSNLSNKVSYTILNSFGESNPPYMTPFYIEISSSSIFNLVCLYSHLIVFIIFSSYPYFSNLLKIYP